ncbi:hypothetical protein F5X68DRAFT_215088 [Plectosphaerella plurivora]|uniref:Uncharacterized protein n=1 Tax=Plectosphaerella plurivora TaxID=936078 RepID=A0A9P9A878_9PEZI|nr:hypothetical protein F5X68DRAFT_215088 [Plectosphaerella plurivora]
MAMKLIRNVTGYFAAAFLKPRDHQKGTCTATLIFLTLLLLSIIVGWTPPGEFITTGLIADHSSFPPHPDYAQAPPFDQVSTRPDLEAELEELYHAHENLKHEEKRHMWEDKDLDDLITKHLEVQASSIIGEDAGSHRHLNGLHGITGAFLINAHYPQFGSLNGAVILAHLTL